MKKMLFTLILGIMGLYVGTVSAQGSVTLQIRDKSTREPIDGVMYKYGPEQGISDLQGRVSLVYTQKDTLFLFHIGYGDWALPPVSLKKAISNGVIYKSQDIFEARPVTVIAMRPKAGDTEQLTLGIEDKLSHDAGAILTRNPVINSIRKSGSYGFDPVLRGFKYEQLNVVIDGAQSAVSACPNRMDPPTSQVAPNMMDHVEVLKGPHSFRYGSSFGGTINFKSNTLRFSKKRDIYGRVSGSTESNGGIYRSEGVLGLRSETYNIGLFASFSKGSDYKDGAGISVPAEFQRASFGVHTGMVLTDGQKLIFSATRNVAGKTDFPAQPMDLISDKTNLYNLKYKIAVNGPSLKSWNSSIYASTVNHKMSNLYKNIKPRMLNAETHAKTLSYGGRTEGVWIFEKSRLYTGADVRIEQADGTRNRAFLMGPMKGKTLYDNVWNGGRINRIGLFSEYQHFYQTIKMIVSGRLEYNQARATDVNAGFLSKNSKVAADQVNPNISIGGYKHLGNGMEVGLWFGHAQRSASLTERYINSFPVGVDPYDMLGNPELKPEINNQLDLTFAYKSKNAAIDINVFSSFLKDYISSKIDTALTATMPSSPGVRRYENIKDAFMTGFEISWQQRLIAGLQHQMAVAFTYGRDGARKEPLPEIAPLDLRYKLVGSYLKKRLQPMLALRYVMKQDRISKSFGETKTPAFSLVDFALSYRAAKNVSATIGVKNLLDRPYYEHLTRSVRGTASAIQAPGRNIYLSVSVDMM